LMEIEARACGVIALRIAPHTCQRKRLPAKCSRAHI
jgi:hypothetical protein